MVWTYIPKTCPLARRPEATAVETNFYSPVVAGGERFDEIESLLAQIEGGAAPLWADIMAGKVLAGIDREKMALFLAAQYLRSPGTIRAGAEMTAYFAHHISDFIAAHKEIHDNSVNEYEAETGETISPDEREEMRKFMRNSGNFTISVLSAAGLPMLSSMGNLAQLFIHMKWVVGRSKDQHLITSDCPVVRISDPATHSPIYGDGAFANKTVRVSFPLSPERLLEMTWQGIERERLVEIPKKVAREMNGIRAENAERYLYANQNDAGIVKLCDKLLGREKRPKIVMDADTPVIQVKRKL